MHKNTSSTELGSISFQLSYLFNDAILKHSLVQR